MIKKTKVMTIGDNHNIVKNEKAMHEYKKNPKTYTIEEIKKLEM